MYFTSIAIDTMQFYKRVGWKDIGRGTKRKDMQETEVAARERERERIAINRKRDVQTGQ